MALPSIRLVSESNGSSCNNNMRVYMSQKAVSEASNIHGIILVLVVIMPAIANISLRLSISLFETDGTLQTVTNFVTLKEITC
ncbi:MAG TPA: hypothetical protein DCW94_02980 [Porticoccaceae bacterium]|nr:hypothetical protein [Porticoccaceae bacterium]